MKKEKILRAIYGSPEKPLVLGNMEIQCYVLEGDKRVLSGRGMQEALGLGQAHGALLKRFVSRSSLSPFINNELAMELQSPVRFVRPGRGGKPALAYEATILTRLCDAVLDARRANVLSDAQERIAEQCELLMRGFATVGIIALIDEVTGFQDIRVKDALEKILSKYLLQEKKPYIGMFPLWFYKEIYRLNGWRWSPENAQKRPGVIGRWTNELIYGKMAPGLVKRLQRLNPTISPGRRAFKHLQLLTDEVGDPALRAHFAGLGALMRASTQWRKFRALAEKAYPDPNKTLELELGYHEKE